MHYNKNFLRCVNKVHGEPSLWNKAIFVKLIVAELAKKFAWAPKFEMHWAIY